MTDAATPPSDGGAGGEPARRARAAACRPTCPRWSWRRLALRRAPPSRTRTRIATSRTTRPLGSAIRAGSVAVVPETSTLVVANIEAAVLVPLCAEVVARVAPGGRLVLSGILVGQEADVARAYEARGMRLSGTEVEGEWVALDRDPFVQTNAGAPPAFLTTFVRTDRERKYTRIYVALWDPRQVELHTMAGTVEPIGAGGETGTGLIPRTPEVMKVLLPLTT